MANTRRGRGGRGSAQGLLTILFTDIESSTALTQRLGDARAQDIVRAHNAIVRREVQQRSGTEIKHTGDGIMATFPSAARAVAAAVAIQDAARTYSDAHSENAFDVKIGLNAGEPVAEDADVFGTSVQLAARTCAEAKGGQILATNVVRELVFGKGVLFADAGTAELKGFGDPVRLYDVSASAEGIDEGAEERRRPLVRWLAVGAVAVAIIATGAIALVFALSGGGDAGADDAREYRELRAHAQFETQLAVVGGDCLSSDLEINGVSSGTWDGDISGNVLVNSDVVSLAADNCATTQLRSAEVVADDVGNSLSGRSFTVITARIGETGSGRIIPSQTFELLEAGVITDGAGLYEGAAGTFACDYISTIQEGLRALTDGDCVVRLSVGRPAALVIAAAAGRRSVGVSLNTKGESDTIRIYGVYRNTTGQTIDGARMRLIAPDGVDFPVERADPAGSDPTSELGWDIPEIRPGETGYFDLTARLRSSASDEIAVAVEVRANGFDAPIRSEPITLTVVR